MFTHNPTSTGKTKSRRPALPVEDPQASGAETVVTVKATTLTDHRLPEKPYVYGKNLGAAMRLIQQWNSSHPFDPAP